MHFQWWWRFTLEENPLRKKMVCSCYNLISDKLVPKQRILAGGGPWATICHIHARNLALFDLI